MTREEKAIQYDNLVREGDRVNRKISAIKTTINRTDAQEKELNSLNRKLQILESKLNTLLGQA